MPYSVSCSACKPCHWLVLVTCSYSAPPLCAPHCALLYAVLSLYVLLPVAPLSPPQRRSAQYMKATRYPTSRLAFLFGEMITWLGWSPLRTTASSIPHLGALCASLLWPHVGFGDSKPIRETEKFNLNATIGPQCMASDDLCQFR